MPNTGRPSRDCHLCRQRRVKCDLARPACQRCTKYGAQCPGYRDQQELVFRNADPTVVRKRKKRQALTQPQIQSPGPGETPSSSSSSSSSSSLADSDPLPELAPNGDFIINTSTGLHWTSHSVPIVLNVYSNLDFIKNMYLNFADDGPLIWAAHLFSRTYVTNLQYPTSLYRDAHLETQRELGTYLGKTLKLVSEALKTPEGPQRDDILATVWLLTNYELLVGSLSRTETLSPWHLHARGLYSILKARGTAPLSTNHGRMAFWPAYSMVQIQALISNTECPAESEEWLSAIKAALPAHPGEGLGVAISQFIIKVCSVQARIFNFLRRRDFPAASREYPDLFGQMRAAEKEFEDWRESNPIGNHVLEVYAISLYQSAIVKGYQGIHLLINFLTHYAPCQVPLEQLKEDRKYCFRTAQNAAQGILESVPRVLGPLSNSKEKSPKDVFDALRVIWPLIAVYIMSICRPEQRLAAEGLLFYIGRELGVRQALNTYPDGLKLPQEAREPLEVSVFESH
ncbi:N-terminal fungal transcription regulatory domain-containing protein [Trichoderma citrinoviride]|uniref:N-terminal fungal transcription regulatory domain-containing protein n=1 Tax=Trichoderma citrinoviride TaxID=58853 RepID=A0A2T4BKZ1_9HYPO|nr:N-terminal fungal transcription regulatory domain-containing protein [Trichoderma citrinoviride]PTB69939.1 N-terminal fungal transcription regulatory domain-containing protein [Trichoderma citrinoviride]